MVRQRLRLLSCTGVILGLVSTLVLAMGQPAAVVLRFTDRAALPSPPGPATTEGNAPEAPPGPGSGSRGGNASGRSS